MATTQGAPRRNGWLTAAAVILLVEGGLGYFYLPILGPWTTPFPFFVAAMSAAGIAAAFGILGHREWACALAGLVAGASILLDGVAVVGSLLAVVRQEPIMLSPLLPVEICAWLVVLFAVARRW